MYSETWPCRTVNEPYDVFDSAKFISRLELVHRPRKVPESRSRRHCATVGSLILIILSLPLLPTVATSKIHPRRKTWLTATFINDAAPVRDVPLPFLSRTFSRRTGTELFLAYNVSEIMTDKPMEACLIAYTYLQFVADRAKSHVKSATPFWTFHRFIAAYSPGTWLP